MTTTVRIPPRLEQALARYCVETRRSKSEVIIELLEKRFVDVCLRYGAHPNLVPRWRATFAIKDDFERRIGCPVYDLLPGVRENTFAG